MANNITVGILRALLTLDSAQFESGMRDAAGSAKKFQADMQKLGTGFSNIGRQATAAFTLPLVAAFGTAAKAAIDFESSFAGVRKTVDASEAEFKVLEQQFRDLARTIPVNVNELNRLGEAAGALGIPKEEIADFTRVMAMLGVTTNVTSEQAANDIAKIQNIFGASGKATENFASALVDLGNKGASTEQEILALASRVASAGNTVGLSQAEVLGFAAAIANVGMEAEAGGSAMSKVFNEISGAVSAGGADLEKFAQIADMSAEAFGSLFRQDAAAATQAFIEGLGRIKETGGDLNGTLGALGITELRQSDLLRRLAGDSTGLGKALSTANTAWKDNNALSKESGTRFGTLASQSTILWNSLKDIGVTLGQALVPFMKAAVGVFKEMVPYVESAAKWFADLPMPIQAVGLGLAGIAAAAGPLLLFFGQLAFAASSLAGVGGLGGLMTSIGKITGLAGFGGLATAVGAVRTALSLLLGPWGLVAAGAAVLVPVLWDMAGGWDGIKKALSTGFEWWKSTMAVLGDLTTIATHLARTVLGWLGEAFKGLVGIARSVFTAVNDWVIKPLRDLQTMVFDATGVTWLFDQIKGAARAASDVVEELALDIKNAAFVAEQIPKLQVALKNTGFNKEVAAKAFQVPGIPDLGKLKGVNIIDGLAKAVAGVGTAAGASKPKVDAFARAVQSMTDDLSGANLVNKANQWVDAIERIGGIGNLTHDELKQFQRDISQAVEKMRLMGQEVPRSWALITDSLGNEAALQKTRDAIGMFAKLNPQQLLLNSSTDSAQGGLLSAMLFGPNTRGMVSQGISQQVDAMGRTVGALFRRSLGGGLQDLPQVIVGALQGGGSVVASVSASLGARFAQTFSQMAGTKLSGFLGGSLGKAIGGIMGPLGAAIAPMIGALVGKIGGKIWSGIQSMFGTDEEAKLVNPARDQFLAQFGGAGTGLGSGFQTLAATLTELTGMAGGGSLFDALIGADTMAKFTEAVSAIETRLAVAGTSTSQLAGQLGELADLQNLLAQQQANGAPAEELARIQQRIDEIRAKSETTFTETTDNVSDTIAATEDLNLELTGSDDAIQELGRTQDRVVGTMLTGFDSLMEAVNQLIGRIEEMIDALREAASISLPSVDGLARAAGVESFATEGIVRRPTLAMVGDAAEPEFVLHRSTLAASLERAFSFGAMTSSLMEPAYAGMPSMEVARTSRAGGDTYVFNASVTVEGAGKNGATLADEIATALPQAMRRDHGLVVKMRKSIIGRATT